MKLPNASRAVVEIEKLRDYSLNPAHEEGKHKARVFAAALGIQQSDAEWLREELLRAARVSECELRKKTEHGQRYELDLSVSFGGRSARIRSAWIVRTNEDFPRLITCYVK